MTFPDQDGSEPLAAVPEERMLAAWEIVSVTTSALIAEWVILSLSGGSKVILTVPVCFAFAFMLYSHRARGETARELGWRVDNFWRAARLLVLPMLAATLPLIIYGWAVGSLNFNRWRGVPSFLWILALGFAWGLLQQQVLQGFINRRAQIIWGAGPRSVLVVALIFAALHLPNPWLTLATFAGGVVWAAAYQRAPNLYALALSHTFMTWVLVSTLPAQALQNLRVGFKYFG